MEILSLGEKIKRKRKELELTLKDLAGDRITPGQISLIESGKSNTSIELLEYLAKELNTSVDYLQESEEMQAEKLCSFLETAVEFKFLKSDFVEAEAYIDEMITYSKKYNQEFYLAKGFYLKGYFFKQSDDNQSAKQYLISAYEIFVLRKNFNDIIKTLKLLGEIAFENKSYRSAISYMKQAEKIYFDNDMNKDLQLCDIYYIIGSSYYCIDERQKADTYMLQIEAILSILDNKRDFADKLFGKALQSFEKSDIENSIKYAKGANEILGDIKEREIISNLENNIGLLFQKAGSLDNALKHYTRAKNIKLELKANNLVDTLINICSDYIMMGDIEKAESTLTEINKYLSVSDKSYKIKWLILKHDIQLKRHQESAALTSLLEGYNLATEIDDTKQMLKVSLLLANIYSGLGRQNEAIANLTKATNHLEKLNLIK